ncbi:hypothetical protein [Arenibacter sp. F20364]|uniref:hypothetical protein n=1 Tax=Arenibacter sp. F20364 TaxID=2926415 RepID=UPI001FF57A93|nr:hypothetical protein [Arenibacter sp. F20364]MCK0191483.1 hypothetical protein [Arenibacter sp. F20364]
MDTIVDLELQLHAPQEKKSTNIPNGYYLTIFKEDGHYRIYNRDNLSFYLGEGMV